MIRNQVLELKKMGRMPDESYDNIDVEIIDKYDELIETIVKPITKEEAEELILLFPEFGLYGVQWGLLHLIESLEIDRIEYLKIIKQCPSKEWRDMLINRLG